MTRIAKKTIDLTLTFQVIIDDTAIEEEELNGPEAIEHDKAMLAACLTANAERLREMIAHELSNHLMWQDGCFFEKLLLGQALKSGWQRETFKPALEQLTGKARDWWMETFNAEPDPEIGDLFREDLDKILECFKVEAVKGSTEIKETPQ